MTKLSSIYQRTTVGIVTAAALALGGCATSEVKVVERQVCDQKCWDASNMQQRVNILQVMDTQVGRFLAVNDRPNAQAWSTLLVNYMAQMDPAALKAQGLVATQMNFAQVLKPNSTMSFRIEQTTVGNQPCPKDKTCVTVGPMPTK